MWIILVHRSACHGGGGCRELFHRFEEAGLTDVGACWSILLPAFLLFRLRLVFSGLYKAKWRFTSLPDLFNHRRAPRPCGG